MTRKLIEVKQDVLVVCDNPICDYSLPYTKDGKNDLAMLVNKPCPQCGQNLLTFEDWVQHRKLMKTVNFINKWFSWITIFVPKKSKGNTAYAYTRNGETVFQIK